MCLFVKTASTGVHYVLPESETLLPTTNWLMLILVTLLAVLLAVFVVSFVRVLFPYPAVCSCGQLPHSESCAVYVVILSKMLQQMKVGESLCIHSVKVGRQSKRRWWIVSPERKVCSLREAVRLLVGISLLIRQADNEIKKTLLLMPVHPANEKAIWSVLYGWPVRRLSQDSWALHGDVDNPLPFKSVLRALSVQRQAFLYGESDTVLVSSSECTQ